MSAIARWDAFLGQIRNRHASVLADAEATARQYIASIAAAGDPIPLSHQLIAVGSRLQELERKIEDTWHAQVHDAIVAEGVGEAVRDREFDKGRAVKYALDDAREELEPRLLAELARQRYHHALFAARALVCTACGTRRDPPITFRAVELVCASCGLRLVFEPGELMRSVAAVGTHALAQEATVVEWREMRAAERRMHAIRPPVPLPPIVDYERSQIAYWRHYLGVRAYLEPELARDPALEIRSRMEQWYTSSAEYHPAWVAAGRPRLPV
jgi:hypothetical protein